MFLIATRELHAAGAYQDHRAREVAPEQYVAAGPEDQGRLAEEAGFMAEPECFCFPLENNQIAGSGGDRKTVERGEIAVFDDSHERAVDPHHADFIGRGGFRRLKGNS